MATLVLGAVGTAIGGAFGGAILGFSGAAIGGFIGSTVGSVVDSWIVSSLAPAQRIEGARLDTLRITSATEGAVIPRLYGRMRIGGNIIWATDFREEQFRQTQGGGKGGASQEGIKAKFHRARRSIKNRRSATDKDACLTMVLRCFRWNARVTGEWTEAETIPPLPWGGQR